jgi:predicted glutamine amidotransferase
VWNGLYYTIREPPFRLAQLVDCDMCVDFSEFCHENDRVAIVSTYPLTNNEYGKNLREVSSSYLMKVDHILQLKNVKNARKEDID